MRTVKRHGATVHIVESLQAVAADASELFTRLAREASSLGRPFRVALSGGSTPRLMYSLLASEAFRDSVDWGGVYFFLGDERWVPPRHPESNYKMARDALLSKVPVPEEQVYPVPTQGISPDEAAQQYEKTLRRVFRAAEGEVPRFDLALMGMGEDGHTASLFPHTAVLHEESRLVAAHFVEKLSTHRVTFTMPVFHAAREMLFLVAGAGKADALKEVLEGEENLEEYPSQLFRRARGTVTWMVDLPSASKLAEQGMGD